MDLKQQIAAFKQIFGLETLPQNGKEALECCKLCYPAIMMSASPQLLNNNNMPLNDEYVHTTSYKQRFIDINTGMNIRYLEWPNTGDDVIILLHDIGYSADQWRYIGSKLSERGYKVFAIDLRGHGQSSRSISGQYTVDIIAKDVAGFIVAKDLYVRPIAVIGCGIGAAIAIHLGYSSPRLVGGIVCVDFGLHPDLMSVEYTTGDAVSSKDVLPWWSFWIGQGIEFMSDIECALFLSLPLSSIGPGVFLPLFHLSNPNSDANEKESAKTKLFRSSRPFTTALQDAKYMLSMHRNQSNDAAKSKIDPGFFFSFDVTSMMRGIATMKSHLLIVHGENSSMAPSDDVQTIKNLALKCASVSCVKIPGVGHHVVSDGTDALFDALVSFFEDGPAVRCFEVLGGADARRAEVLGIRPLPEYASLAEAQKALGPRKIPSKETIDEALRQLRIEECDASVDSDDCDDDNKKTSLARDPPDYFGFVGDLQYDSSGSMA